MVILFYGVKYNGYGNFSRKGVMGVIWCYEGGKIKLLWLCWWEFL